MAINKTISTNYDIDVEHHVLTRLVINRDNEIFQIMIGGFTEASKYVADARPLTSHNRSFTFDQLPTAIKTKMNELKELIEIEMINNLADFSGGTQVKDDGTPMT
jgi:hypothetical protein